MNTDVPVLLAFNRGLISPRGLARTDLNRTALSAEELTNWLPSVLGSMSLRPGTVLLSTTHQSQLTYDIPFTFSITDRATIELTPNALRIFKVPQDVVVTRALPIDSGTVLPPGFTTIFNGTFNTNLDGWVNADETTGPAAQSNWQAGGYMALRGTGFSRAIRRQQVTFVDRPDIQPAVRITIARGPVTFRIGTAAGLDDIMAARVLRTGTHSFSFAPGGNFWIEFSSDKRYTTLVEDIRMESAEIMVLPTEWGAADLPNIRWARSFDVTFVACPGRKPKRIERYGPDSWSIVDYDVEDGPFRLENTGNTTIQSVNLVGDTSLVASRPLFKPGHVGALFQLTSFGQAVNALFTAENQFSDPVRVSGVGTAQRAFSHELLNLTGTGTTVTLQRSVGQPGAWTDVSSFTTNGNRTLNDGLDNQIIWYRLGVKSGDYSSGTIFLSAIHSTTGTSSGRARVTEYISPTEVSAIVLDPIGRDQPTDIWSEGEWSPLRGYPSSVGFFEGRLWWFGLGKIWASISDQFNSFDEKQEGDSATISRSIGEGPSEVINWMLPLQRLLFGTEAAAFSIRSSSIDEPITNERFGIKRVSSQGSASVSGVLIDQEGFYVQRAGSKVFQLTPDDGNNSSGYIDGDATAIVPEIGQPGIIKLAVQRQPDTRLHCLRSDGKVAILVTDKLEEVKCWCLYETDGEVVDIIVHPDKVEDLVYYTVRRGSTVRRERWASLSETVGGARTILADSCTIYEGPPTTVIPVTLLNGRQVVVWADGKALANADGSVREFTVAGGQVTLPQAASLAVIGLPYQARFKSSKLAYAAQVGTALGMNKRVIRIGLVLHDTHAKGIQYGQSFEELDDLPEIEEGAPVDPDYIWPEYDKEDFSFPGSYSNDTRICLVANSPRPATASAIPFTIEGTRT